MDQKKGMSRIRGIIILVLLAVMLVSGAMSIHSWVEDKRTGEEYERLSWPGRQPRSRTQRQWRSPVPRSRRQNHMYLQLTLRS